MKKLLFGLLGIMMLLSACGSKEKCPAFVDSEFDRTEVKS
jgi:hypothetical protein